MPRQYGSTSTQLALNCKSPRAPFQTRSMLPEGTVTRVRFSSTNASFLFNYKGPLSTGPAMLNKEPSLQRPQAREIGYNRVPNRKFQVYFQVPGAVVSPGPTGLRTLLLSVARASSADFAPPCFQI